MYSTWTYTKIVPINRIEYIHALSDKEGNRIDPASIGLPSDFPQDQRHVVTFKPADNNGTEVTMTQYGWTAGQMMEMGRMGLDQSLSKMAAIFARS